MTSAHIDRINEALARYSGGDLGAVVKAILLAALLVWGANAITGAVERRMARTQRMSSALRLLLTRLLRLVLMFIAVVTELKPFPANGWGLDIYESAHPAFSAMVSAASSSATLYAVDKLLLIGGAEWLPIATGIGIASFVGANLFALSQKIDRRLLGYSSVAQLGLVLTVVGQRDVLGDDYLYIAGGIVFLLVALRILAEAGDAREADRVLAQMQEQRPDADPANVYSARSRLAASARNLEKAFEYARRAVEIHPERPDLLAWAGRLALNLELDDTGLEYVRRAWELDPENHDLALGYADLLAIGVPTFGWAEGRNLFVKAGSGAEIGRYVARHPDLLEDTMVVLRYFDAVNFADRIRCPTLLALGLEDDVVPAKTVYGIANHLAAPYELMEFPVSHSDGPEEAQWRQFERHWLRLALEGRSADFGQAH